MEKFDFKASGAHVLGALRVARCALCVAPQLEGVKPPLVIGLPNAGGLDGAGPQYIAALNQRGVATIELHLVSDEV